MTSGSHSLSTPSSAAIAEPWEMEADIDVLFGAEHSFGSFCLLHFIDSITSKASQAYNK